MNKKFIWLSLGVILVAVAVLLAFLVIPGIQAQADSKSLVGSWDTQITLVTQNMTMPGYVTFFSDGNLITDENPNPLETSGHGSWVRTGANKAAFTLHFIVGSTDAAANYITFFGTVSGTANYNPKTDTWNGPITVKAVDKDGNVILDDTGTMNSTRIAAQP